MQPQRIVLAQASRFLRDLFRRVINKTPGLEVAAEVVAPQVLLQAVEQTRAGWVVVSLDPDGKLPPGIGLVLIEHPTLNVLVLSSEGAPIKIKWIESHERTLDLSTIQDLAEVLRDKHPRIIEPRPEF